MSEIDDADESRFLREQLQKAQKENDTAKQLVRKLCYLLDQASGKPGLKERLWQEVDLLLDPHKDWAETMMDHPENFKTGEGT